MSLVADEFFEAIKQADEEQLNKQERGEEYYGLLEPATDVSPVEKPVEDIKDNETFF